ncbi:MAG: membrane protein [Bacteroidetes bacterium]|nr:MAG: membrane protein [Bacteroidota bacterium]
MNEFLIPATIFATIYGIVYLLIRRKERMALLDRGLDPMSFEKKTNDFSSLKYGLLFTGIGCGLIIANILVSSGVMEREAAYFSLVSLFGGIALILDYILEIRLTKKQKKEDIKGTEIPE